MRAVVLFEADDFGNAELALEVAHVADLGAAEGVDALVVIPHRKDAAHRHARPTVGSGLAVTGEQLEPGVLQAVGVLEFVDQDVAEARLVVAAQRFVALQQFKAAQQQFGKIDHAFALALRFVFGVEADAARGKVVVGLGLRGANALFLVRVDEVGQLARREFLVVDVEVFQQALDRRQLVGRVENLKQRRQAGLAVVRAQQAIAQAVEGADPHPAGVDRQERGEPRLHFLGRLVGEGHGEDTLRPDLAGGDQPGDARGQHARLAAARAGEDQRMLRRQGDGGVLLRVEVGKQVGHREHLGRSAGIIPAARRAPSMQAGKGVWMRPPGRLQRPPNGAGRPT